LRNGVVGYSVRAAAVRGGRWLTSDAVLRFGIRGLGLATILLVLRRLLLALIGAVAGGGAIAAKSATSVAPAEEEETKDDNGEHSREGTHT
jgi:hypothetical protein